MQAKLLLLSKCPLNRLATRRDCTRRLRTLVSCTMQAEVEREGSVPKKKRKEVMTAVVQHPQDGQVLVVKRSEKVGTYRLQWGAVSGGIEGHESPVYRCLQEISEEVGLSPDQVAFVRSGRPLFVDDGRLHFAVHPFLFSLSDTQAEIQLNWENVEYAWVPPESLSTMNTVPLLPETYEHVAVPPQLQPALDRLHRNRSSGAAELALMVLDALKEAAQVLSREGSPEGDGTEVLDQLRSYGYHLATIRPSMAPLASAAAAVLSTVHNDLSSRADAFAVTRGEVCAAVVKAVNADRQVLASAAQRLQAQAAGMVKDGMTLLTTSYSSTIAQALVQAARAGRTFRVVVCESRPLNEGVTLANTLADAGVDVTLITDAQAGLFVRGADIVLVGADSLTQDAVVNKVGTYLIALAARAAGVPLYCVADTSKFSPGAVVDLAHPGDTPLVAGQEEKEGEEVTASLQTPLSPGVVVRNVYFEPTPLDYFAGIVTEEGLLQPSLATEHIEKLRQQYREAFCLE